MILFDAEFVVSMIRERQPVGFMELFNAYNASRKYWWQKCSVSRFYWRLNELEWTGANNRFGRGPIQENFNRRIVAGREVEYRFYSMRGFDVNAWRTNGSQPIQ
jgi:hypothetical protein